MKLNVGDEVVVIPHIFFQFHLKKSYFLLRIGEAITLTHTWEVAWKAIEINHRGEQTVGSVRSIFSQISFELLVVTKAPVVSLRC